jgi:aryl-alcohol dehydrogenase-like predicted oxidoreductase
VDDLFSKNDLSSIGIGTWQLGLKGWGNDYDETMAMDALRLALRSGLNFIDTAEIYGAGKSESLIGQVTVTEERRKIYIATKVAGFNATARSVENSLNGSLKRLQTDYIDLYQVHWEPSIYTDLEALFRQLEKLMKDGRINHLGVSNFSKGMLAKASEYLGDAKIESNQIKFNLVERPHTDLLRYMEEHRIKLIGWSPLGQGFLTGKYGSGKRPSGYTRRVNRLFSKRNLARWEPLLETLRNISTERDITPTQLVLAYERELGVYPIPGFKNIKQVNEIAGSLKVGLTQEDKDLIMKICDQTGVFTTSGTMSPRIIPNFIVKMMSLFI